MIDTLVGFHHTLLSRHDDQVKGVGYRVGTLEAVAQTLVEVANDGRLVSRTERADVRYQLFVKGVAGPEVPAEGVQPRRVEPQLGGDRLPQSGFGQLAHLRLQAGLAVKDEPFGPARLQREVALPALAACPVVRAHEHAADVENHGLNLWRCVVAFSV